MPCSRGSSWPGIKLASLWSPASAGGFFTTSTTWETYIYVLHLFVCFIFVCAGSFIAVFRLSLVSESRVYSPVTGVSLHWLLLLGGTGSSCWGALALGVWASVTAAWGPSNCSWRAESMQASGGVGHRLHCSKAHGIFPNRCSHLRPLRWQADSYPQCHQGSPHLLCFFVFSFTF